jgi:anti-anti-sigma factor
MQRTAKRFVPNPPSRRGARRPRRAGYARLVSSDLTARFGDGLATCTVAQFGACVQITAGGELDLAALPLLREAADRAAAVPGRTVVLDLCAADFADTTVVRVAVGLDRRLRDRGGELVVVAPPRIAALFAPDRAAGVTVVEDAPRPAAAAPGG